MELTELDGRQFRTKISEELFRVYFSIGGSQVVRRSADGGEVGRPRRSAGRNSKGICCIEINVDSP